METLCSSCKKPIPVSGIGFQECPHCKHRFFYTSKKEEKSSFWSIALWIIIIGVAIYIVYSIVCSIFSPKWTLMVCQDVMSNGIDCSDNAIVQRDSFHDKDECLQEGSTYLQSYPSYECGYKCKIEYSLFACKTLCNKYGVCDN